MDSESFLTAPLVQGRAAEAEADAASTGTLLRLQGWGPEHPLWSDPFNTRTDDDQGWGLIVAHMLGVDHVGHRFGPAHSRMAAKLSEVDADIARLIEYVDAVAEELADDRDDQRNNMADKSLMGGWRRTHCPRVLSEDTSTRSAGRARAKHGRTLLLVMGDHGMTGGGNHGGGSAEETHAGLWAYSSVPLQGLRTKHAHKHRYWEHESETHRESGSGHVDCELGICEHQDDGHTVNIANYDSHAKKPPIPRSATDAALEVSQIDIVPTLSLLLGLPVPFGSLGKPIADLLMPSQEKQRITSNADSRDRDAAFRHVAQPYVPTPSRAALATVPLCPLVARVLRNNAQNMTLTSMSVPKSVSHDSAADVDVALVTAAATRYRSLLSVLSLHRTTLLQVLRYTASYTAAARSFPRAVLADARASAVRALARAAVVADGALAPAESLCATLALSQRQPTTPHSITIDDDAAAARAAVASADFNTAFAAAERRFALHWERELEESILELSHWHDRVARAFRQQWTQFDGAAMVLGLVLSFATLTAIGATAVSLCTRVSTRNELMPEYPLWFTVASLHSIVVSLSFGVTGVVIARYALQLLAALDTNGLLSAPVTEAVSAAAEIVAESRLGPLEWMLACSIGTFLLLIFWSMHSNWSGKCNDNARLISAKVCNVVHSKDNANTILNDDEHEPLLTSTSQDLVRIAHSRATVSIAADAKQPQWPFAMQLLPVVLTAAAVAHGSFSNSCIINDDAQSRFLAVSLALSLAALYARDLAKLPALVAPSRGTHTPAPVVVTATRMRMLFWLVVALPLLTAFAGFELSLSQAPAFGDTLTRALVTAAVAGTATPPGSTVTVPVGQSSSGVTVSARVAADGTMQATRLSFDLTDGELAHEGDAVALDADAAEARATVAASGVRVPVVPRGDHVHGHSTDHIHGVSEPESDEHSHEHNHVVDSSHSERLDDITSDNLSSVYTVRSADKLAAPTPTTGNSNSAAVAPLSVRELTVAFSPLLKLDGSHYFAHSSATSLMSASSSITGQTTTATAAEAAIAEIVSVPHVLVLVLLLSLLLALECRRDMLFLRHSRSWNNTAVRFALPSWVCRLALLLPLATYWCPSLAAIAIIVALRLVLLQQPLLFSLDAPQIAAMRDTVTIAAPKAQLLSFVIIAVANGLPLLFTALRNGNSPIAKTRARAQLLVGALMVSAPLICTTLGPLAAAPVVMALLAWHVMTELTPGHLGSKAVYAFTATEAAFLWCLGQYLFYATGHSHRFSDLHTTAAFIFEDKFSFVYVQIKK